MGWIWVAWSLLAREPIRLLACFLFVSRLFYTLRISIIITIMYTHRWPICVLLYGWPVFSTGNTKTWTLVKSKPLDFSIPKLAQVIMSASPPQWAGDHFELMRTTCTSNLVQVSHMAAKLLQFRLFPPWTLWNSYLPWEKVSGASYLSKYLFSWK